MSILRRTATEKKTSSPSHARAKKQEKETASRIGGKLTPGSGNKYVGGDVRKKRIVRVEAKTTKNASFSVTTKLIEKLEEEVFGADEIPVIQVELGLGAKRVIVMPDWALDWIVDLLETRDDEG